MSNNPSKLSKCDSCGSPKAKLGYHKCSPHKSPEKCKATGYWDKDCICHHSISELPKKIEFPITFPMGIVRVNCDFGEEMVLTSKYLLSKKDEEMAKNIEKVITASMVEDVFRDFYDGDWSQYPGDWQKLEEAADYIKKKLKAKPPSLSEE